MSKPILAVALGVSLTLICAGCSTPKSDAFADVQSDLHDRLSQRIQWNRRTTDDIAVSQSIQTLLAKELTQDTAVQIALLNNPRLQATYEDLGIAQADLVQAGLLKNPVFTAAIEISDGGKGTKLQFSVLEDFISILQIPLKKHLAESALAQARFRVTAAVVDLAAETQAAFYTAQASQQTVALRRTAAEAAEASYDLAHRIHAAGNSTDLDLAMQEAQLEQAKLDLSTAELQLQRDHERLTTLMGVAADHWQIPARFPDLPNWQIQFTDIEDRAVGRSLDLDLAKSEMTQAAQTLHLTKSIGPFDGAQVGASSEKEVDHTWETGPAFSVPIPLFDTGKAATAAARSRYVQAQQRCRAAELEIRSSARLASQSVLAARSRAQQYRTAILPLRHRITDAIQTQYNAMLAGAFTALDAKREELNAQIEYVAAQRDYWLAQTDLDQLLSGRMPRAHSAD